MHHFTGVARKHFSLRRGFLGRLCTLVVFGGALAGLMLGGAAVAHATSCVVLPPPAKSARNAPPVAVDDLWTKATDVADQDPETSTVSGNSTSACRRTGT